jgi:haloacetate dehalogenase
MSLFPGFSSHRFATSGAEIHYVRAGQGEPVLLLHGYPQTHVCWHRIAPQLAQHYTVIAADLRGYGDSSKPPGLPDHANYSKRAMAQDMAELMASLGFDRFHVVSHDRGSRVSHRLAADHAAHVHTITVMDISPTLKMFQNTSMEFARAYYHWFLMLQPAPVPEELLAGKVPFYTLGRIGRSEPDLTPYDPAALAEYSRCYADPAAIHASCEDYRAAGTIDLEHDRADRAAGKRLTMPLLTLWGAKGVVGKLFNCLEDWREVAEDVSGRALPCGHFLPEEQPEMTLAEVQTFMARHPMR